MPRLQSRMFWLLVLVGHAALAGGWWWFMPHGFPAAHPRFWVNEVLPIGVVGAVVALLTTAYRGRLGAVRAGLAALAATWLAAAVSGRIVFPVSLRWRFLLPVIASATVILAAFAPALRAARWPRMLTPLVCVVAAVIGACLPLTQRAPSPGTRLLTGGTRVPPFADPPPPHLPTRRLGLADVQPQRGTVNLSRGRYTIHLEPLLTFRSRSPDRCWTAFAPRDARVGAPRELVGFSEEDGAAEMNYTDDGVSWLRVTRGDDDAAAAAAVIESRTDLARDVYSHLNSLCHFVFVGHEKLSVTFSPCPDARIDVMNFDYPVGDPARFAYLDAAGRFRVVQASSGEKGPFRTLAEGTLSRGGPLVITLHDRDRSVARVTLEDFAAQASTELSPTAGWRVPQNAIEFSRDTSAPSSPATFFVTLAASSVGRGFDSVGHAAGTYRNRLRVEWLTE